MNKRVCYYPFVVRLFQIGVLEPGYMLEIMNQLHIDFWGKVSENLVGGGGGGGG